MIYTVTLNPAIDYYVVMKEFVEGNLNTAEEGYTLAGGKGINVSKVLKNFGKESVALGFVGGFTGSFIKDDMKACNIAERFIELEENTRINMKLKTEKTESEIAGKSPKISKENIEKLLDEIKNIKKDDILILSGSVPNTIDKGIYGEIIEKLPEGTKVILDTRGEPFTKALDKGVFITKPNIDELSEFFQKRLEKIEEIVEAGKKLRAMGSKNVIISMGKEGSILISEKGVYKGNAPKGKLISSVGAGDSMVAGITYGLIEGKELEEAYKFGIASGSATAFSEGLTTFETMENLLKEIIIEKIG
ncbi:1-phosphofructokinase [uncultured Fusobacterium sp.]|uniref:1-phosphofructokinase n=1 Tax=uncultured Fusobacterium sp. TaxID=159267 RepID=UPI0025DA4E6E|nr:1-phosphofructokinase [uncultured Fusobacterium sp.]